MSAIGMCGTFDVENYGDLLFPLIAGHELRQRLDPVTLQCFSYAAKRAPAWPFDVTSFVELARTVDGLRGMIVGGGHIIRADKNIAPGYFPPTRELHHPLSIWLTPALLALEQGLPVVWNAPGVHGQIPDWAAPMLNAALVSSDYVAVRDDRAHRALTALAPMAKISVVPDTVFGVANLCDPGKPSAECTALREQIGLQRPYLVIQATAGIYELAQSIAGKLPLSWQILVLPIGPALGDANDAITGQLTADALTLPLWPHPLLLTELIAGSEAVIGDSLHLAVAALACGVPVFRPAASAEGKYEVLKQFDTVYFVADDSEISTDWLNSKLGRKAPEAAARNANGELKTHWDRIAMAFAKPRIRTVPPALRALWQKLPGELEAGAAIAQLRAENAALRNSLSWKITSPLRRMLDFTRHPRAHLAALEPQAAQQRIDVGTASGCVMRFESIERHKLLREPYDWALVDGLFSLQHAADLATTFPRDHFKVVKGYDSEKDYAYHARALISMYSKTISHGDGLSAAWRQLAADLLSRRYRAAMTRLTGIDLSRLSMEVNAFHYGSGAWLGPHVDLADKIVTHVLYFNPSWDVSHGGCLNILRTADMHDSACVVAPIVGSSAVLVRSGKSWHAVSRVAPACLASRRSITVTFYRRGAISTMWPPGDNTPTFDYVEAETSA